MNDSRSVLLVQLPVPPPGPGILEGNEPLAAAYLKLYALRQELDASYQIDVLPPSLANTLGDQGLIREILSREPWMVSFSCYLWNIERSLWISQKLKESRPELLIVLGGPEITSDNPLALGGDLRPMGGRRQIDNLPHQQVDLLHGHSDHLRHSTPVDYAIFGEGEQTFAELLQSLSERKGATALGASAGPEIAGLWQPRQPSPPPRATLPNLDSISSPYVEGILDLSDSRMLLETARGCRFRCRYCYYPKGDRTQRCLSAEQVLSNLAYADAHGAKEVVLLDPTLNQRADFVEFLRLLRRGNPSGRLRFSGELRAEGIDVSTARLLKEAGFLEVEIGLQSISPGAWRLMGRPTNLNAFEEGVRAIMGEGITARVDLILGLPGDTVDSIRRGIDYLHSRQLYSEMQVFNLSILPGTAFRQQADELGLRYQPWPPYYVLRTPTLDVELLGRLMDEAEEAFGIEFDPLPPPALDCFQPEHDPSLGVRIDLDLATRDATPAVSLAPWRNRASSPGLCYTLWLRSADFHQQRRDAARLTAELLDENPHTTLLVVLEPLADPRRLTAETLDLLLATCYRNPTYLDRYYSLHPGTLLGSKRLAVVVPPERRGDDAWRREIGQHATLLERGAVS